MNTGKPVGALLWGRLGDRLRNRLWDRLWDRFLLDPPPTLPLPALTTLFCTSAAIKLAFITSLPVSALTGAPAA